MPRTGMVPILPLELPSLMNSGGTPPRNACGRTPEGRYGGDPRVLLCLLLGFFASLLPAAFARQSFLHALFLAGFQIKGVTFHFLDDVFLLHFTLKASECVFEGLALLQSDFCQRNDTPKLVRRGLVIYCKVPGVSQAADAIRGPMERLNAALQARFQG
jgi:hypothetical protein